MGSNNTQQQRVDDMREDLQSFRVETFERMDKLMAKLDKVQEVRQKEEQNRRRFCRATHEKIDKRFLDVESSLHDVDKRITLLFWAGNGISFVMGAVVYAAVSRLFV